MVNGFFSYPTRCCRKSAGPGLERFTTMAITSITGAATTSRNVAMITSTNRLTVSEFPIRGTITRRFSC